MKRLIRSTIKAFGIPILIRGISILFSDIISTLFAIMMGNITTSATDLSRMGKPEIFSFSFLCISTLVICPVLLYTSSKLILKKSIEGEEIFFSSLLNQNPNSFIGTDAGELSSKLIDEGVQLRWAIIDLFVCSIEVILMLIVLFIFLVRINTRFTLFVLLLVTINYLKSEFCSNIVTKSRMSLLYAEQGIDNLLFESMESIDFLSINKLSKVLCSKISIAIDEFVNKALKKNLYIESSVNHLSDLLDSCTYIVILIYGIFLVQENLIDIGTVITMSSYYILLSKQFSNIDKIIQAKKKIKEITVNLTPFFDQQFSPCSTPFFSLSAKPFSYAIGNKTISYPMHINISSGDTVAIVGDNGTGKTSLLYLIMGIYDCNDMELLLNGAPCNKGFLRSIISYIDINSNLLDDTVENYILENCKNNDQVNEVIDQLDLWQLWDQHTSTLSGGERKRVDFARVLLEDKAIIMCDEPEVGLDKYWKNTVIKMLQASKKTIMFTTHDPDFVSLANKIIMLGTK